MRVHVLSVLYVMTQVLQDDFISNGMLKYLFISIFILFLYFVQPWINDFIRLVWIFGTVFLRASLWLLPKTSVSFFLQNVGIKMMGTQIGSIGQTTFGQIM